MNQQDLAKLIQQYELAEKNALIALSAAQGRLAAYRELLTSVKATEAIDKAKQETKQDGTGESPEG